MVARRKQRIKAQPKGILDHCRYDSCKNRTVDLQARVKVDFDKPRLKFLVNHEIKTKNFKIALPSRPVHDIKVSLDDIEDN